MCFPAIAAAIPSLFAGSTAAGAVAAGTVGAAGAATTAMTTAQMLSLGLSAAGTAMGAIGAYNQAQTAKQVASNNATVAEYQAQDALRRGEKEAMDVQRRAAAFKSAQRVGMAAKGLDLTYGTAADLQAETDFFAQADADTARLNAQKEAWNRRTQRSNFELEAASIRPWMSAGSTMLAGGGQVADKWYSYTR